MPNSSKRRRANNRKDMISNLPSEVTQRILQLLPLKDAAKTSILSKCWRYRWLSLPHLELDWFLWPTITSSHDRSNVLEYSNLISKVILHHIGPIHKFFLHTPSWLPDDVDISHWLQFVSRQGVKDFGLHTKKVPLCLFTFDGFSLLTHLYLQCKFLTLPSMFGGFPCLISLKTHCWNADNNLEILISSCPQLETVDIGGFYGRKNTLTIHAPKLRWLDVYANINFVLEGSPNLQTLSMDINSYEDMVTVFSSLPGIENLLLRCHNVIDFNGAAPLETSTILFKKLRTLQLMGLPLDTELDILLFVKLLQGSPQLEKLELLVGSPQPSNIFHEDFSFSNLKNVVAICPTNLVSSLPVIKFLLACCPALEVMTIASMMMPCVATDKKLSMAMELLQLPRASTRAKIVFKANKTSWSR